ncbi:MAG: 4Fe-4S dicluster domain-containing protein, partial [Paraclostridium bifermentans]
MNCFVISDPNKCIGCRTCSIACVVAHSEENIFLQDPNHINFNPRLTVVKTAEVSAPIQCRQCEDAPCANVCPNEAIKRENGAIVVKEEKCVGCKTCIIACPIGAIEIVSKEIK